MAIIKDDEKKKRTEETSEDSEAEVEERASSEAEDAEADAKDEAAEEDQAKDEDSKEDAKDAGKNKDEAPAVAGPLQMGTKRFVYAAYFGGAITVAFLASKLIAVIWRKLSNWKPSIGEARDEIVMPLAALIGVIAAIYYWRRTRARQLAEEVASELSKVTWPSRTEVQNSTAVVIVTTIVATIFFALMDRFWKFATDLIYGV